MKRPYLLPFFAALSALAVLPEASARTFADIKASGVLRVVSGGDLPPFIRVEAERHRGYEPELIEAVARSLGLTVSYQVVPPYQLIKELQEDRADIAIGALGITSTRENKVDFTMPTACAGVSVVSFDPKLQKHTDLVGKSIGVGAGSIMQAYVQKLPFEKKVTVYNSSKELIFAVMAKQVDATFAYTIMGPAVKSLYPKAPINFGPELWRVPIGFMTAEDNVTTRTTLNGAINRYMQSTGYAFLSQRYFKEDVRCRG
ncbi:transporter substrate-binding domain-containing protein [Deinococcus deserti]|uniref:Putative amino acid ABC transporter, periplasmic component n=1 Tax=Deinococcus deserti (strain DSM 17065 / CIP 109153 / LMG 22923 / VCD115) TaxID=546414 RepID=C1D2Y3_DEIDV|nr:transporter substrate-binding domain-containing protein [Deinococcus deserti]ACO47772.1 putative amino acid ABC transporter, periplasmic component [Deinococcus deserti VCD115]